MKKTEMSPVVQNSRFISQKLKRMNRVLRSISQLEVIVPPIRDYRQLRGQNHHQTVTHYGGNKFESLQSIAIGSNDEVILLHNNEVIIFDKDLQFVRTFGGRGQLQYPIGVAADDDVIAVSDWKDHTVKKFTLQGNLLSQFGYHGSEDGQFNHPQGLCFSMVCTKCLLYVVDNHNGRVQVFEDDNKFLFKFGPFIDPRYIALDSSNNIYVTDSDDCSGHGFGIYVFNERGSFIREIKCKEPFPIAIGLDDYIMVDASECYNNYQSVIVFPPDCEHYYCNFGRSVYWILAIAVNSSGTIFVVNSNCLKYYM